MTVAIIVFVFLAWTFEVFMYTQRATMRIIIKNVNGIHDFIDRCANRNKHST